MSTEVTIISPKNRDHQGRIVSIQDHDAWYWLAIHSDGSYASGKAKSEQQAEKEALSFFDTANTSIIINYVRTF